MQNGGRGLAGGDFVAVGLFVDFAGGFSEAAVAAFAALELANGLEQMDAAEVGPETLGDENFSVGDLPEEVVGEAHLA